MPYSNLKQFVEKLGGEMEYVRTGPPGGTWEITFHSRRLRVRVASDRVNVLDSLYVAPETPPKAWPDYPEGERTPLEPDAFWGLMGLMLDHGEPV